MQLAKLGFLFLLFSGSGDAANGNSQVIFFFLTVPSLFISTDNLLSIFVLF